MTGSVLDALVYWHWWVLGVTLMIAEALLPGTFLIWFGVAALVTGAVLLMIPVLPWQVQLMIFASAAFVAILGWRRYKQAHPDSSTHPTLNQRGRDYVGRRFTLSEPIVDGVGRLRVDDTTWRVEGEDLPTGTHVSVTGVEGTILRVERVG